MDFKYWNELQNPETFLENDWNNPARAWVGEKVAGLADAAKNTLEMIEVGPGNGIDYERQFKPLVERGKLIYQAYEGSLNLRDSLRKRHPEAFWVHGSLLSLPPRGCDLVYAKAVLEHQPTLEPSLSHLLSASRAHAIIVWYRPPTNTEQHEVGAAGEHYWTFRRQDVLGVIGRADWQIVEEQTLPGEGNLGWVMRRRSNATP